VFEDASRSACAHWVEIRYKGSLSDLGPRWVSCTIYRRNVLLLNLTLWRPLLLCGYGYKTSYARPGQAVICNFWHLGHSDAQPYCNSVPQMVNSAQMKYDTQLYQQWKVTYNDVFTSAAFLLPYFLVTSACQSRTQGPRFHIRPTILSDLASYCKILQKSDNPMPNYAETMFPNVTSVRRLEFKNLKYGQVCSDHSHYQFRCCTMLATWDTNCTRNNNVEQM